MEPSCPSIEVVIAPRLGRDRERLLAALADRAGEDPSVRVCADHEAGQIVLGVSSEGQLDREVDGLRRLRGIEIVVGTPRVAYRETVTCRVDQDFALKGRPDGPSGYARVMVVVEPNAAGAGNLFASEVSGGAVPDAYVPAVERGVAAAMDAGVLAGHPVVDVKVTLVDGAYHDVESSASAFAAVARAAVWEALRRGGPVLLEPVMAVEVIVPAGDAEAVVRDLRARRGQVRARRPLGDTEAVDAAVPLAALLGYAKRLDGLTSGRGTVSMRFDHRAPVPPPDGRPPLAVAAAMRA